MSRERLRGVVEDTIKAWDMIKDAMHSGEPPEHFLAVVNSCIGRAKEALDEDLCLDRPAGLETERVRIAMRAWNGGPIQVKQIAALSGLPINKRFQNALEYLTRAKVLRRVSRGIYEPVK